MPFDFSMLEPQIYQILSAPGTDLTTISAKRVRRQLLELDPTLTADFLKENKEDVDAVIASVFEKVSVSNGLGGSQDAEEPVSRKRKQEEDETEDGDEGEDEDNEEEETPPPKKARKAVKKGLSDAELARKLSSEINSRTRRTAGKSRSTSNGTVKKGVRAKKSAEMIDSDDEDGDDNVSRKMKPKRKSTTGGAAKGGFAKEYALSEPLAALLKIDKLSRPQVVKQLWVYIKGNELQNPSNKREIMCDVGFRAVFGVDKIDMFRMNKVLGQHLHESEG